MGQSYLKITLKPIRTKNLGSLLMKLSLSNFNLRSPDCYLVRSYLIATVKLRYSENATKNGVFFQNFWKLLPNVKTLRNIASNFCGRLRKREHYR
jgi:hypothetical protein